MDIAIQKINEGREILCPEGSFSCNMVNFVDIYFPSALKSLVMDFSVLIMAKMSTCNLQSKPRLLPVGLSTHSLLVTGVKQMLQVQELVFHRLGVTVFEFLVHLSTAYRLEFIFLSFFFFIYNFILFQRMNLLLSLYCTGVKSVDLCFNIVTLKEAKFSNRT